MVVSGSGLSGTLTDDQMAAPIEQRMDEFQRCRDTKLPQYVGGQVELHLTIDPSGEVRRATVSDSTLGNFTTERCILAIARKLHFSRPKGGQAEFTYPIPFAQGSRVREWDAARLAPEMSRHRKELAACGAKTPYALTVYVGAGGKVTSVGLASSAEMDEGPARCLVERTAGFRFADPLGQAARAQYRVER
jgi:TonB family protein